MKKAYKVTDEKMQCRGYQFEIGKTFEQGGKLKLCNTGFHACEKANDCFNYYDFDPKNRVFEVDLIGTVIGDGDKVCTDKIKFVRELSWHEVLGIVNIGENNTGRGNTGDRNTGDRNTGDMNTGDRNTGDRNTGYWNTGDRNTGSRNTGYRNTGDRNTGSRNTGSKNTGRGNTGDWNTGDWNTGYLNTTTPNVMLFNKDTGISRDDFFGKYTFPECLYFHITKWVDFSSMTEHEKLNNPNAEVCDGYLKKLDYKEEATKSIQNAIDNHPEQIKQIKSLPNFDNDIFEDIFGIRLPD